MNKIKTLEKVAINVKSLRILNQLLAENPKLEQIICKANSKAEALLGIKNWVNSYIKTRPEAYEYYITSSSELHAKLSWRDLAAIRL